MQFDDLPLVDVSLTSVNDKMARENVRAFKLFDGSRDTESADEWLVKWEG